MSHLVIRNVRAILTAPAGNRLVVVKEETSEPGLYGLGCATFTQRHLAVKSAIEDFLKPFLIHADGRDEIEVEDNVRALMAEGFHYIRCQMGGYVGRAVAGRRQIPLLRRRPIMDSGSHARWHGRVPVRLWPYDAMFR